MAEEKRLGDFCWVCLDKGVENPSVGRKGGYPVCSYHLDGNFSPEEMEGFVINLFKGKDEVQS